MECSEVLRIVNFRTIFFPMVFDVLLTGCEQRRSENEGKKAHPACFSEEEGEKGGMISIYPRKEEKISASSPELLFLSPQVRKSHLNPSF